MTAATAFDATGLPVTAEPDAGMTAMCDLRRTRRLLRQEMRRRRTTRRVHHRRQRTDGEYGERKQYGDHTTHERDATQHQPTVQPPHAVVLDPPARTRDDGAMFFGDMDAQQWVPAREWSQDQVPRPVSAVLTATGSLTRFIERHFALPLTVHLYDQFVDAPSASEAALLQCDAALPVLRRQVALRMGAKTAFDAESVLPLDGVSGELMAQLESGVVPLGDLLMDRGAALARSDLSIARFTGNDQTTRWARRSILRSGSGTRALVVECFHDNLWRRIEHHAR